tara:strand:+ start:741 stop:914 length:174 start_codon:yes stop_codon:yes gene_type:complete
MELIIYENGRITGIKYICDECSEQVTEDEGLWSVKETQICTECFKEKQREERKKNGR